jgi:cell division protease FtsH
LRRFFRSAAFPILIVVVLAFFAQRLISPPETKEEPSYNEFVSQVESGQIEEVTFKTKDNVLEVTETDAAGGDEYETGFLDPGGSGPLRSYSRYPSARRRAIISTSLSASSATSTA